MLLLATFPDTNINYVNSSHYSFTFDHGGIKIPPWFDLDVQISSLNQEHLQSLSEIIETTAKNGVVSVATSNVKLFLKTIC